MRCAWHNAIRRLAMAPLGLWSVMATAPAVMAHPAIDAFTAFCFKAGQTTAVAQANMERLVRHPLPFALTFWDTSLEPDTRAPAHSERRCEVAFPGDHTRAAVEAVTAKMATPPVFGRPIPLTAPFAASPGTALIEARELLRKRVAVVEIGTRHGPETFIRVDRLPAGMGLAEGDAATGIPVPGTKRKTVLHGADPSAPAPYAADQGAPNANPET